MIATVGNTGWWSEDTYTTSATNCVYIYSKDTYLSCSDITAAIWADRELAVIRNAVKATETMVVLAKMFREKAINVFIQRLLIVRRIMFCKSGFLTRKAKSTFKSRLLKK